MRPARKCPNLPTTGAEAGGRNPPYTGSYSLAVPAGFYTVQASRPDSYVVVGGRVAHVTANSVANVSLQSTWTTNSIEVEAEYYGGKPADALSIATLTTSIALLPNAASPQACGLEYTGRT